MGENKHLEIIWEQYMPCYVYTNNKRKSEWASKGRKVKYKRREGGDDEDKRKHKGSHASTFSHQLSYHQWHCSLVLLSQCILFGKGPLNTLLPHCPAPICLSVHPATEAWFWVTVHSDEWVQRWETEGEGTPMRDGGIEDALVVQLRSDVRASKHMMYAKEQTSCVCSKGHNARRGCYKAAAH